MTVFHDARGQAAPFSHKVISAAASGSREKAGQAPAVQTARLTGLAAAIPRARLAWPFLQIKLADATKLSHNRWLHDPSGHPSGNKPLSLVARSVLPNCGHVKQRQNCYHVFFRIQYHRTRSRDEARRGIAHAESVAARRDNRKWTKRFARKQFGQRLIHRCSPARLTQRNLGSEKYSQLFSGYPPLAPPTRHSAECVCQQFAKSVLASASSKL